jgi:alpha-methylacyl-CoA racemase
MQPAVAPRFSRTPGTVGPPPPDAGADTTSALLDWGIDATTIEELLAAGALVQA